MKYIKNNYKFILLVICLMVLWVIYDFTVLNYTGSIVDVVTIIANIIATSLKNIIFIPIIWFPPIELKFVHQYGLRIQDKHY